MDAMTPSSDERKQAEEKPHHPKVSQRGGALEMTGFLPGFRDPTACSVAGAGESLLKLLVHYEATGETAGLAAFVRWAQSLAADRRHFAATAGLPGVSLIAAIAEHLDPASADLPVDLRDTAELWCALVLRSHNIDEVSAIVSTLLRHPVEFAGTAEFLLGCRTAYGTLIERSNRIDAIQAVEFADAMLRMPLNLVGATLRLVARDESRWDRFRALLEARRKTGLGFEESLLMTLVEVVPELHEIPDRRRDRHLARVISAVAALLPDRLPEIAEALYNRHSELPEGVVRGSLAIARRDFLSRRTDGFARPPGVDIREFTSVLSDLLGYWKPSAHSVARLLASGGALWLAAEGTLPTGRFVRFMRDPSGYHEKLLVDSSTPWSSGLSVYAGKGGVPPGKIEVTSFNLFGDHPNPTALVQLLNSMCQWSTSHDSGITDWEGRAKEIIFKKFLLACCCEGREPDVDDTAGRSRALAVLKHVADLPEMREGAAILTWMADCGGVHGQRPDAERVISSLRDALERMTNLGDMAPYLALTLSRKATVAALLTSPGTVGPGLQRMGELLQRWESESADDQPFADVRSAAVAAAAREGLTPIVARMLYDDGIARILVDRCPGLGLGDSDDYRDLNRATAVLDPEIPSADLETFLAYTLGPDAPFTREAGMPFGDVLNRPLQPARFLGASEDSRSIRDRLSDLAGGLRLLEGVPLRRFDLFSLYESLRGETRKAENGRIELGIFARALRVFGTAISPELFRAYRHEQLALIVPGTEPTALERYRGDLLRRLCADESPSAAALNDRQREILELLCHVSKASFGDPDEARVRMGDYDNIGAARDAACERARNALPNEPGYGDKKALSAYQGFLRKADDVWEAFRRVGRRDFRLTLREAGAFPKCRPKRFTSVDWVSGFSDCWRGVEGGSTDGLRAIFERSELGYLLEDRPLSPGADEAALIEWQRDLLLTTLLEAPAAALAKEESRLAVGTLLLRVLAAKPGIASEEKAEVRYNACLGGAGLELLITRIGAELFHGALADRFLFRGKQLSESRRAQCLTRLRAALPYDELLTGLEDFERRRRSEPGDEDRVRADSCTLSVFPVRGFLREFSGFVTDTCFADNLRAFCSPAPSRPDDGRPNIVFLAFVRDYDSPHPELVGGTLVVAAETGGVGKEKDPSLSLRACNPREEFLQQIYVGELFQSVVDYIDEVRREIDERCTMTLPKDLAPFLALTNSPQIFYLARRHYFSGRALPTSSRQVTEINGQRYHDRTIELIRRDAADPHTVR